jgi:hypothetical protein
VCSTDARQREGADEVHPPLTSGNPDNALPVEVRELLGEPGYVRIVRGGSTAHVWQINPTGDAIGVARSATRGGLGAQVQTLLGFARANAGLRLRQIVVAPMLCGNRRFRERPDLLEVDDAIRAGWCCAVAFTQFDRISRECLNIELYIDYLREMQVKLYLADACEHPVQLDTVSASAWVNERVELEQIRSLQRHNLVEGLSDQTGYD